MRRNLQDGHESPQKLPPKGKFQCLSDSQIASSDSSENTETVNRNHDLCLSGLLLSASGQQNARQTPQVCPSGGLQATGVPLGLVNGTAKIAESVLPESSRDAATSCVEGAKPGRHDLLTVGVAVQYVWCREQKHDTGMKKHQ
jgi:hypothetical protein